MKKVERIKKQKLEKAVDNIRKACESNAAPMDLKYSLSQVEKVELSVKLLVELLF